MINRIFLIYTDDEKHSKLRAALNSKSANTLADEELDFILKILPLKRQYTVSIYDDPHQFLERLALADPKTTKAILGSVLAGIPQVSERLFRSDRVSAFVTNRNLRSRKVRQLHIYIPAERMQKEGVVNEKT